MKKMLVALIFIICLTGCNKLQSDNSYNYIIHDNYSGGTYDYTKKGYYIDTLNQPNAPYYYVITMGEKSTGGYSIEVKSIEIDKEGNAIVTVIENSPGPDDIVTMAFTYPAVCIEVNKQFSSISIKNTFKEEYILLN